MALEPQQRTGVFSLHNTGLLRSLWGMPQDDYGRLVCFDRPNSRFFRLPQYLDTVAVFDRESPWCEPARWRLCRKVCLQQRWGLRIESEALSLGLLNASRGCEVILTAWSLSSAGLSMHCNRQPNLMETACWRP